MTPRPRRAARVILLDDAGRVLLIRFVIPRSDGPFAFWATPGGGVEPGESDLDAARRELREELGLETDLAGPINEITAIFEFGGEMVEQTDVFFIGRIGGGEFQPSGIDEAERAALQATRWWLADELGQADAPVFPAGLADIVRKLNAR
ncbi:MAG TPA: NUDIX domain-containing protein [Rhizomicrobium sp.]|jgi:8-oxo-dGTP pyrophosphatase MutT (NUDIX family)